MLCFRSSASVTEQVAQGIFLNVYFIKLLNDFFLFFISFAKYQNESTTGIHVFPPSLSHFSQTIGR